MNNFHPLSVVIFALMWSAAIAQQMPSGVMVSAPPARYDHAFDGKFYEHKVDLIAAKSLCRQRGLPNTDACSWAANGICEIVIPTNGP